MATIPSEASNHLQLQGWASVALPRSSNLLDPRAARFRVGVIDWSIAKALVSDVAIRHSCTTSDKASLSGRFR